jgi:hypothetical protein
VQSENARKKFLTEIHAKQVLTSMKAAQRLNKMDEDRAQRHQKLQVQSQRKFEKALFYQQERQNQSLAVNNLHKAQKQRHQQATQQIVEEQAHQRKLRSGKIQNLQDYTKRCNARGTPRTRGIMFVFKHRSTRSKTTFKYSFRRISWFSLGSDNLEIRAQDRKARDDLLRQQKEAYMSHLNRQNTLRKRAEAAAADAKRVMNAEETKSKNDWVDRQNQLIADKIRRRENQRIEMAENEQARRVAVWQI